MRGLHNFGNKRAMIKRGDNFRDTSVGMIITIIDGVGWTTCPNTSHVFQRLSAREPRPIPRESVTRLRAIIDKSLERCIARGRMRVFSIFTPYVLRLVRLMSAVILPLMRSDLSFIRRLMNRSRINSGRLIARTRSVKLTKRKLPIKPVVLLNSAC